MWHHMLTMSFSVIDLGFILNIMNVLEYVLGMFNKTYIFIILIFYMCEFLLCSGMRHDNINKLERLKSQTHLRVVAFGRAMERYVIVLI